MNGFGITGSLHKAVFVVMMRGMRCLWLFLLFVGSSLLAKVELGVDVFFSEELYQDLKGKKVGLITNHTGVNGELKSTIDLFKAHSKEIHLKALFAPEHGLTGHLHAGKLVPDTKYQKIPVYSLHGKTRRPTPEMLEGIDVLIFDIQDVGYRAYTYTTTLFYVMEEAAKQGIEVIVLDRPNPMSGTMVDGPMLDEENWRSFLGYVDVPYCHGMTVGELAQFFNEQYQVGCALTVIPMRGWKRTMSWRDTGLAWIPTSPQMPESDTPLFCATTGILGELGIVNIGVANTLPFKIVVAPWIDAQKFADKLNAQKAPGVRFVPFHYRPFSGLYQGEDCHGVLITLTNSLKYRPVAVQYLLIGMLKTLYPKQLISKLDAIEPSRKKLFCQANGNAEMFDLIRNEKYVAWKLIDFQRADREAFLPLRKKFLLY